MRNLLLVLFTLPLVIIALGILGILLSPGGEQINISDNVKDVVLVSVSSILTLVSLFIGSLIQAGRELEKDRREKRRNRTQPYRDYLYRIINLAQRADVIRLFQEQGFSLPGDSASLTSRDISAVFDNMPPVWSLSAIDDSQVGGKVDAAISLVISYLSKSDSTDLSPDTVRQAYHAALDSLERYDMR